MDGAPATINDDFEALRKILCDSMNSLPPSHVLLHLLSIGVCARCVLRLFGYRGTAYSCGSLTALLRSVLEEKNCLDGSKEENKLSSNGVDCSADNGKQLEKEQEVCTICLGILQFASNKDQALMSESNVNHFAAEICEVVNREGYQVDGFSVEVSVPPVTLANERAIRLYMKKYETEEWFQKESASGSISLKEALRLSIISSLENRLNAKCGDSSFCIQLTYSNLEASKKLLQTLTACDLNLKKGKAEAKENGSKSNDMLGKRSRSSDDDESDAVTIRSLSGLQDHVFQESFTLPPEKVVEPTKLTVNCYRKPIYIGGRYLKFSRKVSQSRWIIDDERMGEASVEELIGSNALLISKGDNYKFHAAGREDIDVRMLGSGRPFLLEISNVRIMPSLTEINQIAHKINDSDQKYIQVRNLSILGSEVWDLMREGEAEKQKQYAALVWIPRSLSDDDIHNLSSMKDLEILQRTPVRVLHRRSPLERKRIIHWMTIDRIDNSCQYFLLHLCTQAGTYIKEFVHGDLGRTYPNIGSMLGCRAEILQLDVTDVKMDLFND